MSDVFPIKALNKIVSDYCYRYLTTADYATATKQEKSKGECTLAYYDDSKQLTIKTMKSTNHEDVMRRDEVFGGCLTLFGSCYDMFHDCKYFNHDISKWDVSGVTDMCGMFFNAESFNGDSVRGMYPQ